MIKDNDDYTYSTPSGKKRNIQQQVQFNKDVVDIINENFDYDSDREELTFNGPQMGAIQNDIDQLEDEVNAIKGIVPEQASSSNKLADKAFVNSSVSTNTANYISDDGDPFTDPNDLPTVGVTNNDYAFVTGTDSSGNTYYDRYKATVSGSTVTWAKEYRLNNSGFTAAQWATINSGLTANDVFTVVDIGAATGPINKTKYDTIANAWPKVILKQASSFFYPFLGTPEGDPHQNHFFNFQATQFSPPYIRMYNVTVTREYDDNTDTQSYRVETTVLPIHEAVEFNGANIACGGNVEIDGNLQINTGNITDGENTLNIADSLDFMIMLSNFISGLDETKQNKLTAGTGITIDENDVISVTGGMDDNVKYVLFDNGGLSVNSGTADINDELFNDLYTNYEKRLVKIKYKNQVGAMTFVMVSSGVGFQSIQFTTKNSQPIIRIHLLTIDYNSLLNPTQFVWNYSYTDYALTAA